MGGGLGDIEETLAAGRRLAAEGFRIWLYRRGTHPLPRSVEGPWEWPPVTRTDRLRPSRDSALTVTPSWGVSAAPSVAGALGRGGPWEPEVADIEQAYGAPRTVHVSLEEFGRTLSAARENRERLREGGIPSRLLSGRAARSRSRGEEETMRDAFRRFRAFDRGNVLHLFATFVPEPAFVREFPEAVLTGPLWPGRYRRASRPRSSARRTWVWYASPASAERIVDPVVAGLGDADPAPRLLVRTPRPWAAQIPRSRVEVADTPIACARWRRAFEGADVRIVTGSRTLLEAIETGGPFLYFNGVLGSGRARRRHRPEKFQVLLRTPTGRHLPRDLRSDLADFATGRRVRAIVRRAAERRGGWARFPRSWRTDGFPAEFRDEGSVIATVARRLARGRLTAEELVADVRRRANS